MPACYGTCGLFERGWHGRCVRVDGFRESVRGTGTVRFRRWGKLELMYHGMLIGARGAARLEALNAVLRGVWRCVGAYHRALRWRLAACCGRRGTPNVWRLRMTGEHDETLCAAIAYEDGREVLRASLPLTAGEERSFELPLPPVEDGALFRLFALNGEATGTVRISENTITAVQPPACNLYPPVKCVAWDLDGTLWTGTLSEGDEVALKPQMVELVKALDARGIVNSICSKNDEDPALAKLRAFGLEDCFVFPQINWGPKSASLRRLSQEMNIALDAIVFVDDREENRAEVRENLPEVRVLDEKSVEDWFDGLPTPCGENAAGTLGAQRRLMYREEMARRGAARAFAGDDAAFLAQSGLAVEMAGVEDRAEVERCRELVNRTNQLTITARRYSEADFDELLRRCETRVVRVRDKYGDYGIVGFVAWRGNRLEELVFSCRVARKGVERQVLDRLPKGLTVEVVATDRNAPIREIVKAWRRGAASC